jgi:hypothetical protein
MRTKVFYTLVAFFTVLAAHIAYFAWAATQAHNVWVQPEDAVWLANYFSNQDYMVGISYALAGAFTVYAFLKLSERRERGIVGMLSGVTLTGFLYFGVCFFTGCCGSPMLAVYLSVLGPSFLGFTKPIILMITILSITGSYFWMERKAGKPCACSAGGVCNSK